MQFLCLLKVCATIHFLNNVWWALLLTGCANNLTFFLFYWKFPFSPAAIKKLASTMTVSYQFRNQLEVLLLSLQGTQPQYVMCFKPNATKQSDRLDRRCVLNQLKYAGAMQVAQIRQLGYVQYLCGLCLYFVGKLAFFFMR